jgi:hypothetical protein
MHAMFREFSGADRSGRSRKSTAVLEKLTGGNAAAGFSIQI